MKSKNRVKSIIVLSIIIIMSINLSIASQVIQRTPNSQVIKNNDGSQTLFLYGNERFMDLNKGIGNPKYVPINDSYFPIITSKNGLYSYQLDNTYTKYQAYFRNNSNTAGAVRFEKDGYYFTYDLSGGKMQWREQPGFPARVDTLGSGATSNSIDTQINITGNKASYVNAFFNTTVEYYLKKDMLKEVFVLNGLPSIKPYTYLEYTGNIKFNSSLQICANNICYKPSGTQDDFETSGQIDFKDLNNNTIFFLPPPIATDKNNNSVNLIYSVHGSNAQMNFWLRLPTSFIENATFPIYLDPSLTIGNATESEVLKDTYVSALAPTTNYGSSTDLFISKSRGVYLQFDLTRAINTNIVRNYSDSWLRFDSLSLSNPIDTDVYYLYDDWLNSSGSSNILSESQINWNNQPCGVLFTNSTFCNLTSIGQGQTDFNVTVPTTNFLNSGKLNISFYVKNMTTDIADISRFIQVPSKENTNSLNFAPLLEITYTPYIDIISPVNNGLYNTDANIINFNISTTETMTSCRWSPNSGITNYTMNKLNSTYFWLVNNTMPEDDNNVTFYCNNSLNQWRSSFLTYYVLDPKNITKCRQLYTTRGYQLKSNISSSAARCFFSTDNDFTINVSIDGNNNYVNLSGGYFYEEFDGQDFYLSNITIYSNYSDLWDNNGAGSFSPTTFYLNNVKIFGVLGSLVGFGDTQCGNDIYIYNSLLNNTRFWTINCQTKTIKIYNTTYQNVTEDITASSLTIIRYWYFIANVKNFLLQNIQNSLVTITNSTNSLINSTNTDSSGNVYIQSIKEYQAGKSGSFYRNYETPHNITTNLTNYVANYTIYNFTLLQSSIQHNVILRDLIPPNTTINMSSPPGGANYVNNTWSANYVGINLTVIDLETGLNASAYPKYCIDTFNNCTPSNFNSSGINITNQGTSYIRYFSNDSLGNAETIKSRTINIDTIYPTTSIVDITTQTGSQTIDFEPISSDLINHTCKYSIFNSLNNIDGINENITYNCNNITSATVTSFGTYNLTIYATDSANNIALDTQTFTVNPSFLSGGGGGGSLTVAASKYPVIGVSVANLSKKYTPLELEIIYTSINNRCYSKIRINPNSIATADYSKVCTLYSEDYDLIMEELGKANIFVPKVDLVNMYDSYKKQILFQGFETQDVINKYELFTSILGNVNSLVLTPPSIDKTKIMFSDNKTQIIEIIYSNKPLKSCEIIGEDTSFTCSVTNATVKVVYELNNSQFFSKIYSSIISVTTQAESEEAEQKRIQVVFRIYNLSYKYRGIPFYIFPIVGFSILLFSLYYILFISKKTSKSIKELVSTK